MIAISTTLVPACGDQSESVRAIREAVHMASNSANRQPLDSQPDASAADEAFQTLNPDRDNPFEYVGDGGSDDPSPSGTIAASAQQISVLGFVELDSPRVFVRIGEQTKVLKLGDTVGGLNVLEIDPPRVKFKMDNLVWTATMFDDRQR